MPYDSQEYEADQQMNVPEALEGTITATASGHEVTVEDVSKIRFFQNVKLTGIAALIDTAAACASPVIKLMNGATTLASVAISGAVGDIVAGSIASPNIDASVTELQLDITGTGTASAAQSVGKYYLMIGYQERFVL